MKKQLLFAIAIFVGSCSNSQDHLPPMMERIDPELCQDGFTEINDVCSWLPPFGSLVLGTVEALDASDLPVDDSCVLIERALVVRLRVDELLWGDDVATEIDVHFGVDQISGWSTSPRIDESGSIDWLSVEGARAGPLVVGQHLGLHVDQIGDYFVSDRTIALLADGTLQLSTDACENALAPYPSRLALDEELRVCAAATGGSLSPNLGAATCYD